MKKIVSHLESSSLVSYEWYNWGRYDEKEFYLNEISKHFFLVQKKINW